jgi:hypothetical protein
MTDSELREIYTRALTSRSANRAACPAPEAIEALLERRGSEEERLATLDHVMSCAACKQEFELLRAIHAAEASTVRPRRRNITWLAAAAVIIVAGSLTLSRFERSSLTRGGAIASEIPLVGTVSHALVWHAVPGAIRYDVEIVDQLGATVFSARTSDTTAALPATLPTTSLNWWVRATLRDGSERRSAIVPLR